MTLSRFFPKYSLFLSVSISLSVLPLLTSCELLRPQRSFIDEMDNDGQMAFGPNVDFPVIGGDEGKVRLTQEEMEERTPKTKREKEKSQEKLSLKKELEELVDELDDEEFRHYENHKNKLKSTSEKIYFLKLDHIRDRDEYLLSKGHVEEFRDMAPGDYQAVRERDVVVGMNKMAVIQSWGQPSRVEVAGNPRKENERWAFHELGRVKYVYFEKGKVSGWLIE